MIVVVEIFVVVAVEIVEPAVVLATTRVVGARVATTVGRSDILPAIATIVRQQGVTSLDSRRETRRDRLNRPDSGLFREGDNRHQSGT